MNRKIYRYGDQFTHVTEVEGDPDSNVKPTTYALFSDRYHNTVRRNVSECNTFDEDDTADLCFALNELAKAKERWANAASVASVANCAINNIEELVKALLKDGRIDTDVAEELADAGGFELTRTVTGTITFTVEVTIEEVGIDDSDDEQVLSKVADNLCVDFDADWPVTVDAEWTNSIEVTS